jgi:hypothetical protein
MGDAATWRGHSSRTVPPEGRRAAIARLDAAVLAIKKASSWSSKSAGMDKDFNSRAAVEFSWNE